MDFEVNRADFHDTRMVDPPRAELSAGQIRLAVERFAFTTNNITYAVAGDMLDYWGFFPADEGWGRLPAMGLGTVAESAHPAIAEGGRYFGFYSMSDQIVIRAEPRRSGFRDVGGHRENHAAAYTDFQSVADDPTFRDDRADQYILLRGVFMTAWLADDSLGDRGFLGATQTLVTSASSKTSICLAACLAHRDDHRSIGLTSERNRSFVESLGVYDEVYTYDEIHQLDPTVASGIVDMAGSGPIRSAVHGNFGDNLRFSLTVGATHWDDQATDAPLPGPRPEFFFAPGQRAKRAAERGPDWLAQRITTAFHQLIDDTDRWLTVTHRAGPDEVAAVYHELLDGSADPATGYVVSMTPGAFAETTGP